jgi:multidrug efflux pump subunit AcrA (membrane-fusion protein)
MPRPVARAALAGIALLASGACRGNAPAPAGEKAAAAGPPTIEVVKVVERPLDVTLSLPGELTPFETVALYARVNGFVKSIRVDRGSAVRAGEVIAVIDAPELGAQKAEAQSKLQGAAAQLAAVRAKAEATAGTYDKLKAASAAWAVAGNDLIVAQEAVGADRGQIATAGRNVGRPGGALRSVSDMEDTCAYPGPYGHRHGRNVRALVG